MRFSREEDAKSLMDFNALKDWVAEAKALGAVGSCIACKRTYGRIMSRPAPLFAPVSLTKQPASATQPSLISAMRDKAQNTVHGAMSQLAGDKPSSPTAAKSGAPKKLLTATGLDQKAPTLAMKGKGGTSNPPDASGGYFLFGFCCVGPCRDSSTRDTIAATHMNINGYTKANTADGVGGPDRS